MRLLHRLPKTMPVWPIDQRRGSGSVVVEVYTALAAVAAGRRAGRSKIRDTSALAQALLQLHSDPPLDAIAIDEHCADALITAAWLRRAAFDPQLWSPSQLTQAVAATEGWTFGVK